jgi:hypothetical protein
MSTELETVRFCSKATPRQEANRKNAQKSTGPRTVEGKEASSQNALKHGLCANRNVIRTESQEEYNIFRDEMIADITPAGAMELMLAERIVSLSWRLKRAEHFQNAAMNALIERDLNDSGCGWHDGIRHQARDEAADGNFDLILGITVNIDFSRNKILEQLLAYEQRIESRLYRAIAELKKMQDLRRMREEETEEVRNEDVSLNEPNFNMNTEFRSQEVEYEERPASSEDYAAKQTQSPEKQPKNNSSILCDLGDLGGESAKRSQFQIGQNPSTVDSN